MPFDPYFSSKTKVKEPAPPNKWWRTCEDVDAKILFHICIWGRADRLFLLPVRRVFRLSAKPTVQAITALIGNPGRH